MASFAIYWSVESHRGAWADQGPAATVLATNSIPKVADEAERMVADIGGEALGAEVSLAALYLSGRLGRPDEASAVKWINSAADAGNPYALYLRLRMREEKIIAPDNAVTLQDAARLAELASAVPALKDKAGAVIARLVRPEPVGDGASKTSEQDTPQISAPVNAVAPKASQPDAGAGSASASGDGLVNNLIAGLELTAPPSKSDLKDGNPPSSDTKPTNKVGTVDDGSPKNVAIAPVDPLKRATIDFGSEETKPKNSVVAPNPVTEPEHQAKAALDPGDAKADAKPASSAKPDSNSAPPAEKPALAAEKQKDKGSASQVAGPTAEKKSMDAKKPDDVKKSAGATKSNRALQSIPVKPGATNDSEGAKEVGDLPASASTNAAPKKNDFSLLQPVKKQPAQPAAAPAGGQLQNNDSSTDVSERDQAIAAMKAAQELQGQAPDAPAQVKSAAGNQLTPIVGQGAADDSLADFRKMVAEAQKQRGASQSDQKATDVVPAPARAADNNDARSTMTNSAGQVLQEIPQARRPNGAVIQKLAMVQSGATSAGGTGFGNSGTSNGQLLVARSANPDKLYARFSDMAKSNPDLMSGLQPGIRQMPTQSGFTFVLAISGFADDNQVKGVCQIFNMEHCELQ